MGSGITEVALTSGFHVLMRDVTQEAVERGRKRIETDLEKRVQKGKMSSGEKEAILKRLSTTTRVEDFGNCDFVIEAAIENIPMKGEIFKTLDQLEANDFPGFVSSRLIFSFMNEAIYALYEGVGKAEEIDSIMKMGANHPMGPLELADFVGLDTVLSVMKVLQEGFGDKYRPCPLLIKYVDARYLGVKSGRGFYQYHK
jgi:3-hydroxyacyl-CoA dehydrogenase